MAGIVVHYYENDVAISLDNYAMFIFTGHDQIQVISTVPEGRFVKITSRAGNNLIVTNCGREINIRYIQVHPKSPDDTVVTSYTVSSDEYCDILGQLHKLAMTLTM